MLRGDPVAAQSLLITALAEHPGSVELRRIQAGVHQRLGRVVEAEILLRDLLKENPGDAAAAFSLARLLSEQGHMAAAAAVMRACLDREPHRHDADLMISAIELLDDCGRTDAATAMAGIAIASNPGDPRLHAYAGSLAMQLGKFTDARRHYLFAMNYSERACEWHIPIGLSNAQRYEDGKHQDFALFRAGLERGGLSDLARAELCFALGKANDDIGEYAEAAARYREGNQIAHGLTKWRPESSHRDMPDFSAYAETGHRISAVADFAPIFIVGMPRSGTTLLAELLSRYPMVRNRGELPWIEKLAHMPELFDDGARTAFERAAELYMLQSKQDDAGNAHWFIDKQPLNFRHIDLILGIFPDAKIIYSIRNPRDTALSIWMQLFSAASMGFAYDFADIASVMRDCERIMNRACGLYPTSIRTVQYEDLVSDPERIVARITDWLGLVESVSDAAGRDVASINTSSLWQARQPVYATSVGRWKHYAQYVPELARFASTD